MLPGKGYQTTELANEVMYAGGKAGAITVTNHDATKPTNKPTAYPTSAPTPKPEFIMVSLAYFLLYPFSNLFSSPHTAMQ